MSGRATTASMSTNARQQQQQLENEPAVIAYDTVLVKRFDLMPFISTAKLGELFSEVMLAAGFDSVNWRDSFTLVATAGGKSEEKQQQPSTSPTTTEGASSNALTPMNKSTWTSPTQVSLHCIVRDYGPHSTKYFIGCVVWGVEKDVEAKKKMSRIGSRSPRRRHRNRFATPSPKMGKRSSSAEKLVGIGNLSITPVEMLKGTSKEGGHWSPMGRGNFRWFKKLASPTARSRAKSQPNPSPSNEVEEEEVSLEVVSPTPRSMLLASVAALSVMWLGRLEKNNFILDKARDVANTRKTVTTPPTDNGVEVKAPQVANAIEQREKEVKSLKWLHLAATGIQMMRPRGWSLPDSNSGAAADEWAIETIGTGWGMNNIDDEKSRPQPKAPVVVKNAKPRSALKHVAVPKSLKRQSSIKNISFSFSGPSTFSVPLSMSTVDRQSRMNNDNKLYNKFGQIRHVTNVKTGLPVHLSEQGHYIGTGSEPRRKSKRHKNKNKKNTKPIEQVNTGSTNNKSRLVRTMSNDESVINNNNDANTPESVDTALFCSYADNPDKHDQLTELSIQIEQQPPNPPSCSSSHSSESNDKFYTRLRPASLDVSSPQTNGLQVNVKHSPLSSPSFPGHNIGQEILQDVQLEGGRGTGRSEFFIGDGNEVETAETKIEEEEDQHQSNCESSKKIEKGVVDPGRTSIDRGNVVPIQ